jgi:hypothetical protein
LFPELITGGLVVALLDYFRRVALENIMKREEMRQLADMMRKSM